MIFLGSFVKGRIFIKGQVLSIAIDDVKFVQYCIDGYPDLALKFANRCDILDGFSAEDRTLENLFNLLNLCLNIYASFYVRFFFVFKFNIILLIESY